MKVNLDIPLDAPTAHTFLDDAVRAGTLTFHPELRRLKNGRMSPYFFNAGMYNNGQLISTLADAYATRLCEYCDKLEGVVLFGPAYKGISLAAVTAYSLWVNYGVKVETCSNRKEAKDHGEGGILIGFDEKKDELRGRQVMMIDDVITDAQTKLDTAKLIKAFGGELLGCIISMDRQERGTKSNLSGAQQFEQETGRPLIAIATFSDLITVFEKYGDMEDCDHKGLHDLLIGYRKEHGASS